MRTHAWLRAALWLILLTVCVAPAGAQRRHSLLRLTFERSLRSEQKSNCSFSRPSVATTFDDPGYIVEVGANAPRYRTIDGNTGVWIEGERTNFCANSSFESNLTGWTTTGLTATRTATARLHGATGLQLTNGGTAAADATFVATTPRDDPNVPGSRGMTNLSVYMASANGADLRTRGIVLTHSGAPVSTALYAAPRAGWYRATGRTPSGGTAETYGIRVPPGVSVYLDAVQLEYTAVDFDFAETSYIPTNGAATTRAEELLTHPAAGYVLPQRGTVTVDYHMLSPYPSGELWWVGRADAPVDGIRATQAGNYYWSILVEGETGGGSASAEKRLYSGPGIHRFQGSWDDQQRTAQVWMDGIVAGTGALSDTPTTLSASMYIGAQGRWGKPYLHCNAVIMELVIEDFPLRKPDAGGAAAKNDYLLFGDLLPEYARDAPQSFSRFNGIIFSRIFGEFWNDIDAPRNSASIARPYTAGALTAIQNALAGKGVTRNFIKAANFGNFVGRPGWEPGYGFPVNWFNDTEWEFVLANLTEAAAAGRQAGFAGFAVDVEYTTDLYRHEFFESGGHSDGRSRTEREQQAFKRGQQLAQTILRAWPNAQLLFIPFETQYGPLYNQLFVGFVEGARLSNAPWVGILNEYGYHADKRETAVGNYRVQNGQLEDWIFGIGGQKTLSYWRVYGEHFNAAWPLGRNATREKQFAYRTPDMFGQQLGLFLETNLGTTAIYEEMCAWWQMSDREARSYGLLPGTELYSRNTASPNTKLGEYQRAIPR